MQKPLRVQKFVELFLVAAIVDSTNSQFLQSGEERRNSLSIAEVEEWIRSFEDRFSPARVLHACYRLGAFHFACVVCEFCSRYCVLGSL